MKTKKILAIIVLTMLVSCTKTAEELLMQSEKNMQESRVDLAINDLQALLKKHPTDSLASKAQYKLSSIYLNWKNDPEMGYDQLELTIKNYTESIHGKQAVDQIKEFPEYLVNKAESLRKQKLLKESVAHLMFNVFGVLWMLVLFYFVIDTIETLMINNDLMLPIDQSSPEKSAYSKTQWSLATFHLVFNIANTSLLLWFIPFIQRTVVKLIPIKDEDDEHFQLKFIGTNALTNEFSLLEAQKEMMKFGKITSKMNGFIKNLLIETDSKKSNRLITKIQKYEEITDRVETEVAEYLSKVSEGELSESASIKIRSMMSIAGDLENIGDFNFFGTQPTLGSLQFFGTTGHSILGTSQSNLVL